MENPYAPPTADIFVPPPLPTDGEAIRREHLKHETSIKGIGLLYLLGGVGVTLAMLGGFLAASSSGQGIGGAEFLILGVILLPLGIFQFVVGLGLRKLRPWTRIPTIILSALSMINIPIGTLIGGYFLYLVVSKKGKTILSPEYTAIIAATPHIKYKTPKWLYVVLGLLVALLIAILVIATRN